MVIEHKYCKHCSKANDGKPVMHPYTAEYYFLNGGVLRKCKVHYKAYEKRRFDLKKVAKSVS